ncbi:MAG: hypothetical protein ACOH2A_03505 [Sphingobacteriaceae bacterium]
MTILHKYLNIIANYHRLRDKNPDIWVNFCRLQANLSLAIHFAALAENEYHKRHYHQRRLKKADLQLFADNILGKLAEIQAIPNFDELYNTVSSCRVQGVGELAIYDTANRIGEYLKLEPEYIYLHAGTRKGAEKLIGKIVGHKICKDQLPEPLRSSDLTPAQLEDILCIFKKNI